MSARRALAPAAASQYPAVRMTVAAIERNPKGAFFIVQINRRDGDVHTPHRPPSSAKATLAVLRIDNGEDIAETLCERRGSIGLRIFQRLLIQDHPDVSLIVQNTDHDNHVVLDQIIYAELGEARDRPGPKSSEPGSK